MAYRQEEYVAEIVQDSGVLKGRIPWSRQVQSAVLGEIAHERPAMSV
jgi:hypothetical protein